MTVQELSVYVSKPGRFTPALKAALLEDERKSVRALLEKHCRQEARAKKEEERLAAMLVHEDFLMARGFKHIAGVDEAGRGPLAGPVVAAAVILPPGLKIAGLNDSKKLSCKKRNLLYEEITARALDYSLAGATPLEIDHLNIGQATNLAMRRALDKLTLKPGFVLVDGFLIPGLPYTQKALIKGDCLSLSIAAASVLAKVKRDRVMQKLDEQYPGYGFARHKGYGTTEHYEALSRFGPCPGHRQSFRLED